MRHDEGISQEEIDILLDVTIPMDESFRRWEEAVVRRRAREEFAEKEEVENNTKL